jgi:aspartate/methionine/tyrosine aminotransferase
MVSRLERPAIAVGARVSQVTRPLPRSAPAFQALTDDLRPQARLAPASGIVDVINAGRDRDGLIPLWAGEGDLATPAFIAQAAAQSLEAGETFYTWQRGLPALREALAHYHERLYGRRFSADEFFVTGSGMQAIQIALTMTVGAGDEIVVVTPAWPNAAAAAGLLGARVVEVPLHFDAGGWELDLDRLRTAISPRTRALFVVSPGNPTGWAATHAELQAILTLGRRFSLWVIADETYARFWYGPGDRAPSFLEVMDASDRVLFVNTFSKNWAMTGWRIGWLKAHPSLGQVIENMIQYATSGVGPFMQRAGVVALECGESLVAEQRARARRGRDLFCRALAMTGRCRFALPQGAFYVFFAVEGEPDSRRLAKRLVDDARVGLAPGSAFGAGGEGFLRACVVRSPAQLEMAAYRITSFLEAGGPVAVQGLNTV